MDILAGAFEEDEDSTSEFEKDETVNKEEIISFDFHSGY